MTKSQTAAATRGGHARLTVLATLAALFGMSVLLSACNTTAGAGEDISAGGKAVTKGADDVKSAL